MNATEIVKGRWYPMTPPTLPDETPEQWTNRMLGVEGADRRPYDHRRNRQCSINWHNECSDREHAGECGCPCHDERRAADELAAAFNRQTPVGTVVTFVDGCPEPPVATISEAYVAEDGWPVVELDTFPNPVWLSWLAGSR